MPAVASRPPPRTSTAQETCPALDPRGSPVIIQRVPQSIPSSTPAVSQTAARLGILAGAALFSTGGAGIKAVHFSGLQVAGLRSGVAVFAVLLLLPSARRLPNARSLLVGVAYALTMLLFVLANKLTTAASTIFLQATAPLYILLLGPWLL